MAKVDNILLATIIKKVDGISANPANKDFKASLKPFMDLFVDKILDDKSPVHIVTMGEALFQCMHEGSIERKFTSIAFLMNLLALITAQENQSCHQFIDILEHTLAPEMIALFKRLNDEVTRDLDLENKKYKFNIFVLMIIMIRTILQSSESYFPFNQEGKFREFDVKVGQLKESEKVLSLSEAYYNLDFLFFDNEVNYLEKGSRTDGFPPTEADVLRRSNSNFFQRNTSLLSQKNPRQSQSSGQQNVEVNALLVKMKDIRESMIAALSSSVSDEQKIERFDSNSESLAKATKELLDKTKGNFDSLDSQTKSQISKENDFAKFLSEDLPQLFKRADTPTYADIMETIKHSHKGLFGVADGAVGESARRVVATDTKSSAKPTTTPPPPAVFDNFDDFATHTLQSNHYVQNSKNNMRISLSEFQDADDNDKHAVSKHLDRDNKLPISINDFKDVEDSHHQSKKDAKNEAQLTVRDFAEFPSQTPLGKQPVADEPKPKGFQNLFGDTPQPQNTQGLMDSRKTPSLNASNDRFVSKNTKAKFSNLFGEDIHPDEDSGIKDGSEWGKQSEEQRNSFSVKTGTNKLSSLGQPRSGPGDPFKTKLSAIPFSKDTLKNTTFNDVFNDDKPNSVPPRIPTGRLVTSIIGQPNDLVSGSAFNDMRESQKDHRTMAPSIQYGHGSGRLDSRSVVHDIAPSEKTGALKSALLKVSQLTSHAPNLSRAKISLSNPPVFKTTFAITPVSKDATSKIASHKPLIQFNSKQHGQSLVFPPKNPAPFAAVYDNLPDTKHQSDGLLSRNKLARESVSPKPQTNIQISNFNDTDAVVPNQPELTGNTAQGSFDSVGNGNAIKDESDRTGQVHRAPTHPSSNPSKRHSEVVFKTGFGNGQSNPTEDDTSRLKSAKRGSLNLQLIDRKVGGQSDNREDTLGNRKDRSEHASPVGLADDSGVRDKVGNRVRDTRVRTNPAVESVDDSNSATRARMDKLKASTDPQLQEYAKAIEHYEVFLKNYKQELGDVKEENKRMAELVEELRAAKNNLESEKLQLGSQLTGLRIECENQSKKHRAQLIKLQDDSKKQNEPKFVAREQAYHKNLQKMRADFNGQVMALQVEVNNLTIEKEQLESASRIVKVERQSEFIGLKETIQRLKEELLQVKTDFEIKVLGLQAVLQDRRIKVGKSQNNQSNLYNQLLVEKKKNAELSKQLLMANNDIAFGQSQQMEQLMSRKREREQGMMRQLAKQVGLQRQFLQKNSLAILSELTEFQRDVLATVRGCQFRHMETELRITSELKQRDQEATSLRFHNDLLSSESVRLKSDLKSATDELLELKKEIIDNNFLNPHSLKKGNADQELAKRVKTLEGVNKELGENYQKLMEELLTKERMLKIKDTEFVPAVTHFTAVKKLEEEKADLEKLTGNLMAQLRGPEREREKGHPGGGHRNKRDKTLDNTEAIHESRVEASGLIPRSARHLPMTSSQTDLAIDSAQHIKGSALLKKTRNFYQKMENYKSDEQESESVVESLLHLNGHNHKSVASTCRLSKYCLQRNEHFSLNVEERVRFDSKGTTVVLELRLRNLSEQKTTFFDLHLESKSGDVVIESGSETRWELSSGDWQPVVLTVTFSSDYFTDPLPVFLLFQTSVDPRSLGPSKLKSSHVYLDNFHKFALPLTLNKLVQTQTETLERFTVLKTLQKLVDFESECSGLLTFKRLSTVFPDLCLLNAEEGINGLKVLTPQGIFFVIIVSNQVDRFSVKVFGMFQSKFCDGFAEELEFILRNLDE
jgi:hypothetical protein